MGRLKGAVSWTVSRVVHSAITVLLLLAVGGTGLHLYFSLFWHPEDHSVAALTAPPSVLDDLGVAARMERVEAAVIVYRLQEGVLPNTLTEVVDAGLLQPMDIYAPSTTNPYYYRRHDDRYELLPPIHWD